MFCRLKFYNMEKEYEKMIGYEVCWFMWILLCCDYCFWISIILDGYLKFVKKCDFMWLFLVINNNSNIYCVCGVVLLVVL